MSIANVEAVRAFLYIFQFVEDAFNRGVSAFNATSTFFDTVGWAGKLLVIFGLSETILHFPIANEVNDFDVSYNLLLDWRK